MTAPVDRNRLEETASPYLQLHADNPVNWQPWDDQALEAARERDVPIFLSVGYSACHWCHVMEEESFADEAVAAVLNESFVPIKVDREERPDIDRIYQTVCQQVTGRGGWPLSAWLTPEGEPFYVGTYFPREGKRGMPGFLDVLDSIRENWENDRESVLDRADQWTSVARRELESLPDASEGSDRSASSTPPADDPNEGAAGGDAASVPPDEEASDHDFQGVLLDVAETIHRGADRQYGGFGNGGPKFPQPPRVDALLRAWHWTDRDQFGSVARTTLDAMADGGMYDHLGGGFHRYATDREWVVPHFEKMLYDNAELPRIYADAYRLTDDSRYRTVVEETLAFVRRELRHPDGGLYSTLNAQSPIPDERRSEAEGEPGEKAEGAFYVWTPEEVRTAIDDDSLADLFCARYGVTDRGNFEGKTVLTIDESVEALSNDRGLPEETVRDRLETARQQAFEHREQRPRPSRDEKVITAWNGLLVGATADASLAIESVSPDLAAEALAFVRDRLWDGDRLARRYKDGDVGGTGYLEDYAFLGRGAVRCFEATGDVTALAFALEVGAVIEAAFWDEADGTLYFTPEDGEGLIARPQEPADQSTPSSLGVAVELLCTLDPFVAHDRYRTIASTVVGSYRSAIDSSPLRYPTLAICADRLANGGTEITVVPTPDAGRDDDAHGGEHADTRSKDRRLAIPEEWRSAIGSRYVPNRILAPRPPTDEGLARWLDVLGLDETPPIWAARDGPNAEGETTAYVCRNRTCSPPLSTPAEIPEWIDRLGRGPVSDG